MEDHSQTPRQKETVPEKTETEFNCPRARVEYGQGHSQTARVPGHNAKEGAREKQSAREQSQEGHPPARGET